MKVHLKRKNNSFHLQATGSDDYAVDMDASPEIGGEGKGTRPMELLLMSIGGCASIDFGLILKKQKQDLIDYSLEVSGERNSEASKALKSVELNFILEGDLDLHKVELSKTVPSIKVP